MIYPIIKYHRGNQILNKPARIVTAGEARNLVPHLLETMYATGGIGLAAPQLGIAARVAVIDVTYKPQAPEGETVKKDPIVLVNPQLLQRYSPSLKLEGCLSIPNFQDKINRCEVVVVRTDLLDGPQHTDLHLEGLAAQAAQHEIDHLNGILWIDHLSGIKRTLIRNKIAKLQKRGRW